MVEVIKRGQQPGHTVHEITCRFCKSELRFKQHEGKITHDQREGDFISICCPVCGNTINKGMHA